MPTMWNTPIRVQRRTRRDGDCVVWTGKRFRDGDQFGRVRVARIAIPVHRAVYSWEFGVVPNGMDVRQHCGNPLCIHPGHLMLSPTGGRDRLDPESRLVAHVALPAV